MFTIDYAGAEVDFTYEVGTVFPLVKADGSTGSLVVTKKTGTVIELSEVA